MCVCGSLSASDWRGNTGVSLAPAIGEPACVHTLVCHH